MIQWFPGHMAKAINQIKEKQNVADLFIVVLDARAPISSYNEDFDKIAPHKPRLFVITKYDLADIKKLDHISSKFNANNDRVVFVDLKNKASIKRVMKQVHAVLEPKRIKDVANGLKKPRLRAIVVGVPNAGKSTLINALSKSRKTNIGNMPGVTKGQQWVNADGIMLLDTPGILWPKFEDELTGVKLAMIGSVKIDIIPQQELSYASYKLLSKYYPDKIKELSMEPSDNEIEIYNNFVLLAKSKKYFLSDGKPNLKKTYKFFIYFVRDLKGVTYD